MTELQRIRKVINWLIYIGFADSEKEIAEKLGYTKSAFSQIINGKVPLSERFISNLCAANDNINFVWVLRGEGEMLSKDFPVQDNKINSEIVLLLPISAQAGRLNDFVVSVKDKDCEKVISPIRGADFAITITGESMAPEYPNGSQIFVKRINENAFIAWGKVYVLDTCNGTIIKRIFPSDDGSRDKIKCVSINPEFPPFEIRNEDIFGYYRVMLCISMK